MSVSHALCRQKRSAQPAGPSDLASIDLTGTWQTTGGAQPLVQIDFSYTTFYRLSVVTFALGRTV